MELMGSDLHKIVRTQPLTDEHVQFFIYQIVRGLKVYMLQIIIGSEYPSVAWRFTCWSVLRCCFTSWAHEAGARLIVRLLYVPASVCLFIYTSRVRQVTSLHYYASIATSTVEATGSLQAK